MTAYLEFARAFDLEARLVEAAWAYELAIANGARDRDTVLDLVFVYLELTDPGLNPGLLKGGDGIGGVASLRAEELLRAAAKWFPQDPEMAFWRVYLSWILPTAEAVTIADEEFFRLAEACVDGAGVIALHRKDPERYAAARAELARSVATGRTARERYIRSLSF